MPENYAIIQLNRLLASSYCNYYNSLSYIGGSRSWSWGERLTPKARAQSRRRRR